MDAFVGQAADGRVQVELDADGTLRDIVLDPRVAYLPVEELRVALLTAFASAFEEVQSQPPPEYPAASAASAASAEELNSALTEATDAAERRFAEISTALFDISRRAGRSW
ncbi:YbaB/EbfC family nucleoid-associated protein [Actinoplanes sp. NBC_00393]|uniref:YbaB/EbfC family nucleoid-associated protein n=1 Tax=Actinoplanes sp. NBC_00393 TaxID=2975953 RepID=UPI002E1FD2EE